MNQERFKKNRILESTIDVKTPLVVITNNTAVSVRVETRISKKKIGKIDEETRIPPLGER
jgi:FKBP-type peptidyl-prolyl cis-trans isomerase 2